MNTAIESNIFGWNISNVMIKALLCISTGIISVRNITHIEEWLNKSQIVINFTSLQRITLFAVENNNISWKRAHAYVYKGKNGFKKKQTTIIQNELLCLWMKIFERIQHELLTHTHTQIRWANNSTKKFHSILLPIIFVVVVVNVCRSKPTWIMSFESIFLFRIMPHSIQKPYALNNKKNGHGTFFSSFFKNLTLKRD